MPYSSRLAIIMLIKAVFATANMLINGKSDRRERSERQP